MPSETDMTESYLRGVGQLTVDAIVGVADIVESMHRTITTFGGLFAGAQRDRMRGLTGLVYSNFRTVTTLVGGGLDAALAQLAARMDGVESSTERDALVAALNGVVGDYLVATDNPLAIPMHLRHGGAPVSADDPELRDAIGQTGGRVVLMIHGSSCTERQFSRNGHNHGEALAEELGYVPIYLRYNSGRHISENGAELADLLDTLVTQLPEVVDLIILAHSMGGLVARSACHYAEQAGYGWRERLNKLVCLATPHHGALLERSGNWVDNLLQISPYSAPLARLGKIRSAGVTDLRYGNVLHRHWQGRERFERSPDNRCPVPLPDGVDCFSVAATIGAEPGHITDHVVGDGLVQLDSALGRHRDRDLDLSLPPSHQLVARSTSHLDILGDPTVYATIRDWIAS
jgi:pimeloyl-ACP methyl ester carboxylesterase